MNEQTSKKRNHVPGAGYLPYLLIVVGAATYANSLDGPFIFDDREAIVENMHIRQLWPLWRAMAAPPQTSAAGRPVISLSLAVNYALGDLDVRGYHLFNITVHILCALVLFGIVRRTLLCRMLRARMGRIPGAVAFACALIWMVHPVHSECINYVTQRTESVMGLFYLLTLYCAIRATDSNRRHWWYGISLLSCALGMASKEAMVTAPVIVLLYDVVFISRSITETLRKRWGLYAGLSATWIVLAALMWSGPRSDTVGFSLGVSSVGYAMNQCIVIMKYLRVAIWPHPLLIDYGYADPRTMGEVAPFAAALALLLVATIAALVKRPTVGFCGAWFFMILAPTSSFVPISSEVGAERRMYLPLAGLVALVVVSTYALWPSVAKRFARRSDTWSPLRGGGREWWIGASLVAVVAGALVLTTVRRNEDYRTAISLWQTVVKTMPENYRGHCNLGAALHADGRTNEAIAHFRRALALRSDYLEAHLDLGVALTKQGKTTEAISHYRQVVRIAPGSADAHYKLGNALSLQEEWREAIDHYRQALRLGRKDASAHYNLGVALGARGNPDEAMEQYRQAIQISSDFVDAHYALAIALKSKGKIAEAMEHYRQIVRVEPGFAEAHYNLGNILFTQGKLDEAIVHYRRATEAKADFAKAYHNLGFALASQRRLDEAVGQYRQALRVNPGYAEAHRNLASTLRDNARLAEALGHFREALVLSPNSAAAFHGAARILATHPDPDIRDANEAMRLAKRACQLVGSPNAAFLDTLAAAYAATGQFEPAIAIAEEALRLSSAANAQVSADGIRERLELYRQAKPYRAPVATDGVDRP